MNTKIFTVKDNKNLFIEALINKTDKVSKVSNHSVLNGIAYGVAKLSQKEQKDSALIESQLFPEYAYGEDLDIIARRKGILPRRSSTGSSTWVRLWGAPATGYVAGYNKFISTNGIEFELETDVNIDESGITYAKVRSTNTGENTNTPANTIVNVVPKPQGHEYVINEVAATGGSGLESDESFIKRIQENINSIAADTLSKLKSIITQIQPLVLDIKKGGFDSNDNVILYLVTRNGSDLLTSQLNEITSKISNYLSLSFQNISNELNEVSPKVSVQNIVYEYIDIEANIELYDPSFDIDQIRKELQTSIMKMMDFTTWDKDKLEWEDLYLIMRNHPKIKFVPEQTFSPHSDITIGKTKLPRLRGFVLRDLSGNVVLNENNTIVPIYYSSEYINTLNLNIS